MATVAHIYNGGDTLTDGQSSSSKALRMNNALSWQDKSQVGLRSKCTNPLIMKIYGAFTHSRTGGQPPNVNPGMKQSIPMDSASHALGYSVYRTQQHELDGSYRNLRRAPAVGWQGIDPTNIRACRCRPCRWTGPHKGWGTHSGHSCKQDPACQRRYLLGSACMYRYALMTVFCLSHV